MNLTSIAPPRNNAASKAASRIFIKVSFSASAPLFVQCREYTAYVTIQLRVAICAGKATHPPTPPKRGPSGSAVSGFKFPLSGGLPASGGAIGDQGCRGGFVPVTEGLPAGRAPYLLSLMMHSIVKNMRARQILLSVTFVFLLNSYTYPEISQYFDRGGNSVSPESKSTEENLSISAGIQRFTIPEGILLRKDIRYEFYPVFGNTFSEVVRSAEENSPADIKNKTGLPSASDWTLGWSYKIDYSDDFDEESKVFRVSAELYDINVFYDIMITLPTLIDDTVLSPAEKDLWKNYYLKLLSYEHDHAKIIRDKDAQEDLRKKFNDLDNIVFILSPPVDIEKFLESFIKKETEKIGREWVKNLRKRSDEYARATEYGFSLHEREAFFSRKEK